MAPVQTLTLTVSPSVFSRRQLRLLTGASSAGSARRRVASRPLSVTCAAGVAEIKESDFPSTVLESNRPVLVEFVATWCGPCRLISPAMEAIAQEYSDRLTVVKIDHDANPQLIAEYKVYGLPTLIFFKNGQEVPESRREGAITKAKLQAYVDDMLKKHFEQPSRRR